MGGGREEVFEDLDEIFARFVTPMADIMRTLSQAKFFMPNDDLTSAGNKLAEEKAQNESRIPYGVVPHSKDTSAFLLVYVPGRDPRHLVGVDRGS